MSDGVTSDPLVISLRSREPARTSGLGWKGEVNVFVRLLDFAFRICNFVGQAMIKTDLLAKRFRTAACVLMVACALAVIGYRSLNDALWSDELLTTNLLGAESLPRLWAGIALGIDGNPPFYLTAAWLIVHWLPKLVSSVVVLKLINLALAAAGVAVLGQLARRVASALACRIGALLFVTLSNAFIYIASELRTYALYFLVASLATLCQQRLIERRGPADVAWLALANVGLAMSHTFGIAYVGIIAFAGWLSAPRGGKPIMLIAIAVLPALIAVGVWSPFLLEQLLVAKPYNWMMPPTLSVLLDTLFESNFTRWVSIVEAGCLFVAGILAFKQDGERLCTAIHDPAWQPMRFIALVLAGVTAFTLAAWLVSKFVFPLFVIRYLTPQLFVAFALHVTFAEWMLRHRVKYRIGIVAICAVIAPLALRNVVLHARGSVHSKPYCATPDGKFFEESFVHGDLPVIVDSPHMFLPRATYAPHGEAYRFPLDWDVVLKYPDRSRGNAVDYHLMQGLQTWRPLRQIETTDEILRAYPRFLVIEQPYRAWFLNLITTHQVTAEKMAETIPAAEDEILCTLWMVTRVVPHD
jgi:hypothetical protein